MRVLFHGTGRYPVGTRIGPACWPHPDLLIASRGTINLLVGKSSFEMAEGDAIIIPPGMKFSGEGRSPNAAIWVLHYKRAVCRKRPRIFHGVAQGAFVRELLAEITLVYHSSTKCTPYLASLSEALIMRLEINDDFHPAADIKQSRLLPQGPTPQNVREMAQAAGLSHSHYRSQFRQIAGVTPRQYLRGLKTGKARELLRETRLPIKEIAERVGYGDVVSFHRAFTAVNGCTPARFRREGPLIA